MEEMQEKMKELEAQKEAAEDIAKTVGAQASAQNLLGAVNEQLAEAEKNLEGASTENKSKLQEKLAKKRAAMEAKAAKAAEILK
eukprot:SAG31_NODE_2434_length_5705_cov_6.754014_5_plen_84_part_00